MKTITLYQVDAFTQNVFSGNPAAVCPLEEWPADEVMLQIAQENNLSETAFIVPCDGGYHIRWFSSHEEMILCGHATLATAWVIFHLLEPHRQEIHFQSLSGVLTVTRSGELITLNFQRLDYTSYPLPYYIVAGLNVEPLEFYKSRRYLAVLETEAQVKNLSLNLSALAQLDCRGIIVTAQSDNTHYDFVSRYFTPKIPRIEDPVTGSAHCVLAPYWAKRLNKTHLVARQLSVRGGDMVCELRDNRVFLSGYAALYMKGEIVLGA